jgi:phospholipid/cholesterol/gamma-HCH transport system ATP-binding protein
LSHQFHEEVEALITDPEYILYDEPTTGLDPIMSESIDNLVKDLSEKLKVTSIVVTHDMISVNIVASRVALAHEGKSISPAPPRSSPPQKMNL